MPILDHQSQSAEQETKQVAASGKSMAPPALQLQASPIQMQKPEETEGGEYPYEGTINTSQVGFHKEPRVATNDKTDYIRPDFELGSTVTVLGKTPNGWLKVKRKDGGQIGYVDRRYIDKIEEPEHIIELDELVVERLSKASINEKARIIKKKLEINKIAWNPANMDWAITDNDVTSALQQLRAYYDEFHHTDFGEIVLNLKAGGHLTTLFEELNDEHIKEYYDVLLKLAVFMPSGKMLEIFQRVAVEEGVEEAGKVVGEKMFRYPTLDNLNPLDDGAKDVLRYPTGDNWNPLDVDGIKSTVKDDLTAQLTEFLDNQDSIMAEIDANVEAVMKLKAFELTHYLETGNHAELKRQLIEIDNMADAALELLFSDNPTNSLLTSTLFAPVLPIWDKIKGEPEVPNVYLNKFGKDNHISNFYDHSSGELVDPSTKKKPAPTNNNAGGANNNSAPGVSSRAKTFIKELIVREAENIHVFFYEDMVEISKEYPEMVGLINQTLNQSLKPAATSRLSEGVKIDNETNSENIGNSTLNSMSWMDMVRVWYYELGEKGLGNSRENALQFGPDAITTKEIMNHPSGEQIIGWAKARVKAGDYSEFRGFVHYDVNGFYKAIASKDILFNFMGSFSVTVTPNKENGTIKFQAYNSSSKESATRFRRNDNAKPGEINKVGMFENSERGEEGIPNFGGNLHAFWTWTVPIGE